MTIRSTVATGLVLVVAVACAHGQTVFISPVTTVDGGVALADPYLAFSTASVTSAELGVWAILDPNQTLEGQSLNLVATSPGVIEFTSVEAKNPDLEPLADLRWQYTNPPAGETNTPGSTTTEIYNFAGFLVGNLESPFGTGIGPGSQSVDPLYDAAANAWLLATVTYDVVGFGSTPLYLQIGANGLLASDAASEDINVVFGGSGDPPLNAGDDADGGQRGQNSLTADAVVYNVLFGDVNDDARVDQDDIDPFLQVLLSGPYTLAADMNTDGMITGLDVDPFVAVVAGGGASALAVPEPSSLALMEIGLFLWLRGGPGQRRSASS